MGILDKVIGLAGVAAGGIIAATSLLGNKEKKLAALETEFAETTRVYQEEKCRLMEKIKKGKRSAERRLVEIEEAYAQEKSDYEIKRQKLLPKKTQEDLNREAAEREHRMRMEELNAKHALEMEKLELKLALGEGENTDDNSEQYSPQPIELPFDLRPLEIKNSFSSATAPQSNNNCASNEVKCSNCGTSLPSEAQFCSFCGCEVVKPKKFCIKCGTQLAGDAKFCIKCGEKTY